MEGSIIILSFLSEFMKQNLTIFLIACFMMLMDILSGCIVGLIKRKFSSTKLREGLGHKLGFIIIMCVIAIIQVAMFDPNFNVDFDFPLFNAVCGFIIFIEFVSIVENATILNPKLDSLIGKYFKRENVEDNLIDNPYVEENISFED